jgi:hypothetical protein
LGVHHCRQEPGAKSSRDTTPQKEPASFVVRFSRIVASILHRRLSGRACQVPTLLARFRDSIAAWLWQSPRSSPVWEGGSRMP